MSYDICQLQWFIFHYRVDIQKRSLVLFIILLFLIMICDMKDKKLWPLLYFCLKSRIFVHAQSGNHTNSELIRINIFGQESFNNCSNNNKILCKLRLKSVLSCSYLCHFFDIFDDEILKLISENYTVLTYWGCKSTHFFIWLFFHYILLPFVFTPFLIDLTLKGKA